MPRKAKSYKEFPQSHFVILKDFREGKKEVSIGMKISEATSSRHQLYRFFKALRSASLEGDPVAERLFEVARNLTIHVVSEPPQLLVKINPLSVALTGFDPTEEKASGEEPLKIDAAEIENIIKGRKSKS